jgi:hypothetical protein
MGGAVIGGCAATQTQEQRLQAERDAAIQDLRRETYATYLRAAESLLTKWDLREQAGGLETKEQQNAFLEVEAVPLVTARAEVDLVAEDDVQKAAKNISDAFVRGIEGDAEWRALRKKFVEVAQDEISLNE